MHYIILYVIWALVAVCRGGSNTEGRYYLGGIDLFLVFGIISNFFTLGETQRRSRRFAENVDLVRS